MRDFYKILFFRKSGYQISAPQKPIYYPHRVTTIEGSMIFTIIGLLIMLYALMDFHRAFLIYLVFRLFLVQNISVLDIPGMPLLTLAMLMTIYFLILFWLKKKRLTQDTSAFPYYKAFCFVALSYFCSSLFAYIGFMGVLSQLVRELCSNILFVWMIWRVVTIKDFKFLFYGITVSFFFITIYGIYEHFILSNPLAEYEATLMSNSEKLLLFDYGTEGRGYRVKSVFEHAIGGGMLFALYVLFAMALTIKYDIGVSKFFKNLAFVTSMLCIVCIFFANSRGPILFFLIGVLGIVNLKRKRFYKWLAFAIIIGIIVLPLLSDYFENIMSIFDGKAQEKVGGSNAEMRFDQLDAAYSIMKKSPLFGLGYKYANEINSNLITRLLGTESMWFMILPTFGIVGICTHLYYAYVSVIKVPKQYASSFVFYVSLAYWVVASLTSTPGYILSFHYLVITLFLKQSQYYLDNLELRNTKLSDNIKNTK